MVCLISTLISIIGPLFFFHHSHISPQNPDNLLCNCLSALLWVLVSFWLDTYRIFMAVHQHCLVLRWTKHKHLQMWATEAQIQNDAGYDTIIMWQQHCEDSCQLVRFFLRKLGFLVKIFSEKQFFLFPTKSISISRWIKKDKHRQWPKKL